MCAGRASQSAGAVGGRNSLPLSTSLRDKGCGRQEARRHIPFRGARITFKSSNSEDGERALQREQNSVGKVVTFTVAEFQQRSVQWIPLTGNGRLGATSSSSAIGAAVEVTDITCPLSANRRGPQVRNCSLANRNL